MQEAQVQHVQHYSKLYTRCLQKRGCGVQIRYPKTGCFAWRGGTMRRFMSLVPKLPSHPTWPNSCSYGTGLEMPRN